MQISEEDDITRPAPRVGESFTQTLVVSPDAIKEFARIAGDSNPIHCDEISAASSIFGCLIACGPHTASLMMSTVASHFSKHHQNVGLETSIQWRKAIRANDRVHISWTITEIEVATRMRGKIATLLGTMKTEDGQVAVLATAKVLIFADDSPSN